MGREEQAGFDVLELDHHAVFHHVTIGATFDKLKYIVIVCLLCSGTRLEGLSFRFRAEALVLMAMGGRQPTC